MAVLRIKQRSGDRAEAKRNDGAGPGMKAATVDIVIVGGGPAGMMAGPLFARAGVRCGCWKSTPTSSAISAATPSTPRRWKFSTSSGCLAGSSTAPRPGDGSADPRRRARLRSATFAPQDAGAVHRDDAAMGLSRLSPRRGQSLSRLRAGDGGGSHRPGRGDWPHRGVRPGGRPGDARRQACADERRPLFAGAQARPPAGYPARRADGRAVVPPAQGRQPRREAARRDRYRAHGGADRPANVLAGRIHHPQGHGRDGQGARRGLARGRDAGAVPRARLRPAPLPRLPTCTCSRLRSTGSTPGIAPAFWRSATQRTP